MKLLMKSFLPNNKRIKILGTKVNCSNYKDILNIIDLQIKKKQSHFVCVAATHLLVEAQNNKILQKNINKSLVTTTDGMPLVWIAKLRGQKEANRVYGPDLMLKLCALAAKKQYKIFLLGGANGQGQILKTKLLNKFPNLKIAGFSNTPNRPIPEKENQKNIQQINKNQAQIVFVGLGCPIQEKWMTENYKKLNSAVCIGVGAAFDFISGKVKQAPMWMQKSGLEWFWRLIQEPKRLWKRYLFLNLIFIKSIFKEEIKKK